uniref:CobW C-terminal domain-containing protein n=1 Tax=Chromera velia CCMP2878 TaxID=1169474 RepID=A0A0G4FCK2_9ALVE|eukprot:Cvel_16377.t1-p1 / transcript=Cvel_16377.t1 / gene=Cvel_16377 / organism=Chromera_velia_CCMP2878 / gene_product=Uncharacterized GTP-binding protein YjiA, putative / transcript_product=Uncharacterized GTP-binding protein YjiA, putative / location=Cvel_scaffold1259:24076-31903(-) / protein_length=862 / sequence_SO=supercontig / SO=protein_coding / is_pseudo=false
MWKLTVALHPEADVPNDAEIPPVHGVEIAPTADVNLFLSKAEESLLGPHGMRAVSCLLISPSRDRVLPIGAAVSECVGDGETVWLLGHLHHARRQSAHSADETDLAPDRRIPVTILTGFLGSGKTTTLNHLLHVQRDKRVAVIENEFGAVPIDNDLLTTKLSSAEQVVVMDNGCMCCTMRGDLLGAFEAVMQTAKGSTEGELALDSVVIETTGMADPMPIVRTFMQSAAICEKFRLEGVVTLVDCRNIRHRLLEGMSERLASLEPGAVDEAFQQILFADKIILNKVDLVTANEALEVWEGVRAVNADARTIPTHRGRIPPALLAGGGARRLLTGDDEHFMEIESEQEEECGEGCGHDHSHSHDHGHGHGHGEEDCHEHGHGHSHGHNEKKKMKKKKSRHVSDVGSFSLVKEDTEVDPMAFARWVRLLSTLPKERGQVYRSKAVLAQRGSGRKLVFHAVCDVVEKHAWGHWDADERRGCKIVFIGRSLDKQFLTDSFVACLRPVSSWAIAQTPSLPAHPSTAAAGAAGGGSPQGDQEMDGRSRLEKLLLHTPEVFSRCLLFLPSIDAVKCGLSSSCMAGSVLLSDCTLFLAAEGVEKQPDKKRIAEGLHPAEGPKSFVKGLYLHHLVSAPVMSSYVKAVQQSGVEVVESGGLRFTSAEEVESLCVTLMELCEIGDGTCKSYVGDFKWRPENIKIFFASPTAAASSSMLKITYENEEEDEEDDLKFRIVVKPYEEGDETLAAAQPSSGASAKKEAEGAKEGKETAGSPPPVELQGGERPLRVRVQTIGGRSASQVYICALHSVCASFQLHIAVPDHRIPIFDAGVNLFKGHPLLSEMERMSRLRFLLRVKPDGSGPLEQMCGCC